MSKKIISIILFSFMGLFAVFMIYLATLGMFASVEVKSVDSESKIIYGKRFLGNMKSQEFQNIFMEVGELHESKKVEGKICGWYMNNPEKSNGEIEATIGIMVTDSNSLSTKIDGFMFYVLPPRKVVQAYVNADFKVAAAKTYTAIANYAKEKNVSLREEYFEWYDSKEDVFVEVEIK